MMFLFYLLLSCFTYGHQFNKTDYDLADKYTIELLVVIDPLVRNVKIPPGMDHKSYIMHKIKQADEVYRNYDIGNRVEISVYDVIEKHIDTKYRQGVPVLNAFCKWVNREKSKNRRFDYALYFTDLGKASSYGYYNKCGTETQCGMIAFQYEPLADFLHLTIVHELGHSLNVGHDDEGECNIPYVKNRFTMMSKASGGNQWSDCAKKQIEFYLKSPFSICLHNKPERNLLKSVKLNAYTKPISRNQTCQFIYGPKYFAAGNLNSCINFGCSNSILRYSWPSSHLNGIQCGHSAICMDKKCTSISELKPVHGGWTNWIREPFCSLSCGGGVRLLKRYCTNPSPKYGGKYCSGKSTMYEMCNLRSCGHRNLKAIRDSQCDNGKSIYVSDQPCALYCGNSNKLRVADGTPCYENLTGKCLGGYCLPADCQNVIYGNAVVDKCGVCNGGNRNCYVHKMHPTSVPLATRHSYQESGVNVHLIATIPKGSANILIEMEFNDRQHANLALKTSQSDYTPNRLLVSMYPTDFQLADYTFKFKYANKRAYQIIKSIEPMGSTTQDIDVYVHDYYRKGVKSISYQWYNRNPKNKSIYRGTS